MKNIKYLVLDVDGTMTDGCVYMGENGEVAKAFSIKDGYGLVHIAMANGITPVIITGRKSKIVENRCAELKITEIYQGVADKTSKLKEFLAEKGGSMAECAYMGDDLNDIECMKAIKAAGGLVGAPGDAALEVINIADFISTKDGGRGCVREFIEWLVQ